MDASRLDLLLGIAVEVVYILIILFLRRKGRDRMSFVIQLIREILKLR